MITSTVKTDIIITSSVVINEYYDNKWYKLHYDY